MRTRASAMPTAFTRHNRVQDRGFKFRRPDHASLGPHITFDARAVSFRGPVVLFAVPFLLAHEPHGGICRGEVFLRP